MKKRIISLVLVFALVISVSCGAFALNVTSLDFSNSSPLKISALPGQLLFELPSDSDFTYLRVSLIDSNDNELSLQWHERQSDNTIIYSLKDISDGTYYVNMYRSSTQYGSYNSYIIGKSAKLVIKDGASSFQLARTYEINTIIHRTMRTDSEALKYYLNASSGIESDNKSIITLASSITKDVKGNYQRALAIHDWVCKNIWYDDDVLYQRAPYGEQTAMSTMNSKRGVCLGIANLTAALLRAAGIPAKVISGYALGIEDINEEWTDASASAKSPANHAWNEFYADGRWVVVDATWDTSNVYANGSYSKNTGIYGHYYFDVTLDVFSSDHLIYTYSESQIPAEPQAEPAPAGIAAPNTSKVVVNDREITFEAYTINGENYFKLRDVAYTISGTSKQFDAKFDGATQAIALTTGTSYTTDGSEMKKGDGKVKTPVPTTSKIYKDGKEIELTAYTIGGNNFFKMRDIASAFNIFIDYVNGVIIVDTSRAYAAP